MRPAEFITRLRIPSAKETNNPKENMWINVLKFQLVNSFSSRPYYKPCQREIHFGHHINTRKEININKDPWKYLVQYGVSVE